MKNAFVRKEKILIGPVFSGPIKAAADHAARPQAAITPPREIIREPTAAQSTDPGPGHDRRILQARLGAVAAPEAAERVQKNLSIARADATRMAGLARRDRLSQARLLARALDCYEATYGPWTEEG